jgi:predicted nucleic acid-binding protein
MRWVLDASVAVALAAEDESSELAQLLVEDLQDGDELLVPPIWPFEAANAFVMRFRRGAVDAAGLARTNADLAQLPIVVASFSVVEVLEDVAALARFHGLTTYDASYLHLALREKVPLATGDLRLRAAAEAAGCEVFH